MAKKRNKSIQDQFLDAIANDDLSVVKALLSDHAKGSVCLELSNSLWFAATQGKQSIAQMLIDAGADAKEPASLEYGIESLADVVAFPKLVKTLIGAGADPHRPNEIGWTPLMMATWENRLQSAKAIVSAGGDPNAVVYDDDGEKTAYLLAVQQQHAKLISWLEKITDVELVAKAKDKFAAPDSARLRELDLLDAIDKKQIEKVKQLLQDGVNPDCRDDSGIPALFQAAKLSLPITQALIENGADVNARFELHCIDRGSSRESKPYTILGANALHHSMHCADDETISLLIDSGIDVNAVDGIDEITVLMEAVQNSRPRAIRELVEHGADATAKSRQGKTATEYRNDRSDNREQRDAVLRQLGLLGGGADAYLTGNIASLDALKESTHSGFDFNATDDQRRSCLYMAIIRGQTEFAEFFIESGANVNYTVGHDPSFDSTWAGVNRLCAECGVRYTAPTDHAPCPSCGSKSTLSEQADPQAADHNPALLRFLQGGVNTCFHPYEMSPIIAASRLGQTEVVRKLRAAGTRINSTAQKGCLMAAIWFDHRDTARALIESAFDLNHEHHWSKETAASLAAIRGDSELVSLLSLRKAKCRFDEAQIKAITVVGAAEVGDIVSVECLVADGADVDAVSSYNGLTPLCAAAMFGQVEMTNWLLNQGANSKAMSKEGALPSQLALKYKHNGIVAMLE